MPPRMSRTQPSAPLSAEEASPDQEQDQNRPVSSGAELRQTLESLGFGIPEYVGMLLERLRAMKVETVFHNGVWHHSPPQVDWRTRAQAAQEFLQVTGIYKMPAEPPMSRQDHALSLLTDAQLEQLLEWAEKPLAAEDEARGLVK